MTGMADRTNRRPWIGTRVFDSIGGMQREAMRQVRRGSPSAWQRLAFFVLPPAKTFPPSAEGVRAMPVRFDTLRIGQRYDCRKLARPEGHRRPHPGGRSEGLGRVRPPHLHRGGDGEAYSGRRTLSVRTEQEPLHGGHSMSIQLTGRDGVAVTIPDGGIGLQGRDGQMVAIPSGYTGIPHQHSDARTQQTRKDPVSETADRRHRTEAKSFH